MHRFHPLLLIFVVLFASCGTARKSVVPDRKEVVLTTSDQRKYEYYFLEVVKLEQLGRYDEAYEMLQHCLAICPTAPSALYKTATYHFVLNQKDKAEEALLRAVEGAPDNYWYRQTLASYYQSNREYDKAIAIIEEMQQRFPNRNSELLPALVGLYNHTGQYDKVIDALTRLEQLTGKSEAISMEKMRNYLLMGNEEGGFNEMETLAAEYPDNLYYRVILAEVYMEHGRVSEAEPILQHVLTEDPDNGPAKITLAEYYRQQADTARYLAWADSVVMSADVTDEFKVRMMAQLIKEQADSLWVMALFERAIARPQRSAKLGHLCVQYMLSLEQPEERIRPILLRMLEAEPDHIPARSQLLAYAAMRNDTEEMVSICSDGIDYTPEVLTFYYYKGVALHHFMGRTREALDTYHQATRQITEESDAEMASDIYTAMGNIHYEQEQLAETYLCYDTALVYNPSNMFVLNNYAYFLAEEERDLERAEQMSRQTIEAEPDNATYLDTYAWVLYKLKRYEEALNYIERALAAEAEPSDELYEHAGDICKQLGYKHKAIDYWYKAFDLKCQIDGMVDMQLKKKIEEMK